MQKHDIDRFYRKVMTCIKAGGGSSCNVVVARQTGRQPRLVALPHQLIKRSILVLLRKVQGFTKKDGLHARIWRLSRRREYCGVSQPNFRVYLCKVGMGEGDMIRREEKREEGSLKVSSTSRRVPETGNGSCGTDFVWIFRGGLRCRSGRDRCKRKPRR